LIYLFFEQIHTGFQSLTTKGNQAVTGLFIGYNMIGICQVVSYYTLSLFTPLVYS